MLLEDGILLEAVCRGLAFLSLGEVPVLEGGLNTGGRGIGACKQEMSLSLLYPIEKVQDINFLKF